MVFATFVLSILAVFPQASAGSLERVTKEIWKDRFDYTCFKREAVKGFAVQKLWKYSPEHGDFYVPVVLGADGSIIVTDSDGTIHILSQKGKVLGVTEALGRGSSAPLALSDGNIAYATNDHDVYFLSSRGEVLTRAYFSKEKLFPKGVIAFDDTVIAATRDKSAYIFNSDGTVRTHIKLPAEVSSPPIVTAKQVVAISTKDRAINFFSISGKFIGQVFLKPYSPADAMRAGPDGDIIVKSFAKNIHYIDSTLKIREEFEIQHSSDRDHGALFLPNGRIVLSLAPFEQAILFIKKNGDNSWQVTFGHRQTPMHEPILGPTGQIVVALKGGELRFLDTEGYVTGRFTLGPSSATSLTPVVLSDGTAVIGWEGGAIHWVRSDGTLHAKFDTGYKHATSQLLALPDDRVIAATNRGDVLMLKASSKRKAKYKTWSRVECPLLR